jgi:hypothetical protein
VTAPFSTKARIVNPDGTPSRELIAYLQAIGSGVVERTTYTAAQILAMTPSKVSTAICTDSSVTTFGATLAGGGANTVPVYWDLANWRVG